MSDRGKKARIEKHIAEIDRVIVWNAEMYDDWWEERGVITVRRRYRNERDEALRQLAEFQQPGEIPAQTVGNRT